MKFFLKLFLNKYSLKFFLSFVEILTGILLVLIGFLIQSTDLSNNIAEIVTAGSIIPGILLIIYSRHILVGNNVNFQDLTKNITLCFFINIALLFLFVFHYQKTFSSSESFGIFNSLIFCFFFGFVLIFQPLTSIWFHVVSNAKYFIKIKILISSIRLIGAIFALIIDEKALFITILVSTPMLEFFLFNKDFKSLKNMNNFNNSYNQKNDYQANNIYSISVGFVRMATSIVKIKIERFFPGILATLIIFETIFAGMLSIYEKYFIKDIKPLKLLINIKISFCLLILFAYIVFNNISLNETLFKTLIFIFSISVVLPSILAYASLKKYGALCVSKINFLASSLSIFLLLLNIYYIKNNNFYFFIYIFIPISIFVLLATRFSLKRYNEKI